jgi:S1-C subfamily serine protease
VLIGGWCDTAVPGLTRRLLLAVLAALAPAVAASPAGAAGHSKHPTHPTQTTRGIVDIYTKLGYESGAAAGTGMIVTRSGEVLTNNHVIRGATAFKIVDVSTHRTYAATVVGYSVARDVALLQLANATRRQTIRVGRSGRVRVGQQVVALGNAQGRGGPPKAAPGKVIALHRQIVARDGTDSEKLTNLIATNVRAQPGDSGGPLQDAKGRTIGMVTAGSTSGKHRGFAIPITQALSVVHVIERGTSTAKVHVGPTAFLGVGLQDVPGGAEIAQVVAGSAAEAAGLTVGDVITSLDGATISSSADVKQAVVSSLSPGTPVSIGWTDTSGTPQTGTITPTSGPPQ